MCIPSPRASALPASNVPSMQSAAGITLGGQGIQAGLGRLKLREAAPAATTQTPPATPAVLTPAASTQVGLGVQAPTAASTDFQNVPNKGLRLPKAPA